MEGTRSSGWVLPVALTKTGSIKVLVNAAESPSLSVSETTAVTELGP